MALAPSRANTSPGWLFVAGLPDPSSPGHPFNDFGIDAQEPLVAINPDHIVQLSDKLKALSYTPQAVNLQD